jgi:hypothetical protein
MRRVTAALLIIFLFNQKVLSRDVPNYILFNDYVYEVIEASLSAKTCEQFGFVSNNKNYNELSRMILRKAYMEGINKNYADNIIQHTIRERVSIDKGLQESLKNAPADKIKNELGEYLEYWHNRCIRLSESEISSEFILDPGPEIRAKALRDWADKLERGQPDLP